MEKIKVLQFPIANSQGGITQYVLNNWRFIDRTRFHFDFATMSKKLDMKDELEAEGCKVHFISCYAEENQEQFVSEIREILKEDYDVIHLHTKQWKSFLIEEIAKEYGVPKIIVHSHSTGIDTSDPVKRQEEIALHEAAKKAFTMDIATDFCACSWLAADFLFGGKIPKSRIKILKNAIDVNRFSYNTEVRNTVRQALNLEGCFVLGNVGRMTFSKNQEFLMEVMREIPEEQTNIRLLLIGSGELEEELRRKAEEYKLQEKVIFLGRRKDVDQILQAIDVLLLPSRFEGLPVSLIEAQTAGLKCLASEAISEETLITGNLERLPLDKDLWSKKCLELLKGYDRKKMEQEIKNAGYDIREQIKIIEEMYGQNTKKRFL